MITQQQWKQWTRTIGPLNADVEAQTAATQLVISDVFRLKFKKATCN